MLKWLQVLECQLFGLNTGFAAAVISGMGYEKLSKTMSFVVARSLPHLMSQVNGRWDTAGQLQLPILYRSLAFLSASSSTIIR